uniref:Uncharacterized protein n=1 Tax=Ananas comosus var. bracteatus TaxID=296719 RepID=A0A6V7PUF4_ANACO|nr:unnamed protein product [Ananas comosus var. bracteatus]
MGKNAPPAEKGKNTPPAEKGKNSEHFNALLQEMRGEVDAGYVAVAEAAEERQESAESAEAEEEAAEIRESAVLKWVSAVEERASALRQRGDGHALVREGGREFVCFPNSQLGLKPGRTCQSDHIMLSRLTKVVGQSDTWQVLIGPHPSPRYRSSTHNNEDAYRYIRFS